MCSPRHVIRQCLNSRSCQVYDQNPKARHVRILQGSPHWPRRWWWWWRWCSGSRRTRGRCPSSRSRTAPGAPWPAAPGGGSAGSAQSPQPLSRHAQSATHHTAVSHLHFPLVSTGPLQVAQSHARQAQSCTCQGAFMAILFWSEWTGKRNRVQASWLVLALTSRSGREWEEQ